MPHADPETKRAYHRDYKRRNRWRYRPTQKFYDAARHANERAARAGAPGVLTADEVRGILTDAACVYCGAIADTLDHRIPLATGGPNVIANVVPACFSCNASKFNGDRPRRWSRQRDDCARCGTTARRHAARGLCSACYQR